MTRTMMIAWLPLLLILSISVEDSFEERNEEMMAMVRRLFDPIYKRGKNQSDLKNPSFRRITQLYSRNSGDHIRILPSRKIDAMGKHGDKYAKLIIESDNFGRVRIRGSLTKLYLCIDKRRRLRARVKGKRRSNCIFHEHFAKNAFTEFVSVNDSSLYIAFNRRGRQRACNKTRSGMKAVQFIEMPLKNPRLYMGRKNWKNKRNGQMEKGLTHQRNTVCITVKNWAQWRKYLKWRRRQKKLRRNLKSKIPGKRKQTGLINKISPKILLDTIKNPRIQRSIPSRLTTNH